MTVHLYCVRSLQAVNRIMGRPTYSLPSGKGVRSLRMVNSQTETLMITISKSNFSLKNGSKNIYKNTSMMFVIRGSVLFEDAKSQTG